MIWTTQPRSDAPGRLAVWRQGQGPALVLIHGVGLRAEAWAAVMPRLSQVFTVHALDMPGHGGSPLAGAGTLADFVDRVETFVRFLDRPAAIAGHSMGAMIATEVAGRLPSRTTGLAALNAIFQRQPDAAKAVQARAGALDGKTLPSPDPTLRRWFGDAPDGSSSDAANACRGWLSTVDPEGYATAYRIFAQHDGPSATRLGELSVPALFQTGRHDPNSTPVMSEAMAMLAPKGIAITVEDAAHMMPMTHPDAVANALIQTFCASA